MGYSIYVKTKNKKESQRLINRIPNNKSCGDSYYLTTDIVYINNCSSVVGFNYQSCISDQERKYIFSIIKWFAGLVNKNYYFYDCEKIVFVK